MESLNNFITSINSKYLSVKSSIQNANPYHLAAATTLINGVIAVSCNEKVAAVIRTFTNAMVGHALVSSGRADWETRDLDGKMGPLAKMLLGGGFLLWSAKDLIELFQTPSFMQFHNKDKIVVVGDVHGDLQGLQENLRQAGLIDGEGNWIGEERVFVQLGDIVDRGPQAKECWEYLRKLQTQAKASGGKVIRIMGNHELMWLGNDFRYANPVADTPEVKKQMQQWIREDLHDCEQGWSDWWYGKEPVCRLQAGFAAADGKIGFFHAGLTDRLAQILKEEIAQEKGIAREQVTNEWIVEKFNARLRDAIPKTTWWGSDQLAHPMFQAGGARGGNGLDGIFWADKSVLDREAFQPMIQIVGHNPPKEAFENPIRVQNHVIYADGGMFKKYGGNRCFVEIGEHAIYSHCKKWFFWMKQKLS